MARDRARNLTWGARYESSNFFYSRIIYILKYKTKLIMKNETSIN